MLTYDSEGENESEIYKDCDITPPGTFSPCLPVTYQFPEMENVKLVEEEKGQISLGYIWENLKPCTVVVGNIKPATMSNVKETCPLWR